MNNKSNRFEVSEVRLAACWNHKTRDAQGFEIEWSIKGGGFGSLSVGINDGELWMDSECMSPDFCKRVFGKLVDDLFEVEKLKMKISEED